MRALICGVALLMLPATLEAQRPATITPEYRTRFLQLGSVTHFESTWSGSAGFLWQHSLQRSRVETMPDGRRELVNPRFYVHTLATAGIRFDDDGGDRFRAFAQLGLARRNDSALFTTTAVLAQAVLTPRALGPAVRVEIKDNIGLNGGWLFVQDNGDGLYVSVDYMRNLFCDLGILRC